METTLMAESEPPAQEDEAPVTVPPYLIRREPILDQNRGLCGYRLRILWTESEAGHADPGAALIQAAREHGVGSFLAYAPHWVDATPALLHNAFTLTLPRSRCYLEFPESLEITPELIQSLQGLAHAGLKFSLRGDLAAKPEREALLPFVRAVGFDPALSTKAEIFRQSFQHKQAGRMLMAVNTPDKATLDNFLLLGFTVFQGHWPMDRTAASLTPRQKILLRLITLIMGEGEAPEIESCLKQDAELVKTLLDMVNTPAYGLSQEVESLSQAIMLLGRRQLQRWIQVLMYTEAGRPAGYLSPILVQASARAHLMEALSTLRHPDQSVRAEAAFTTGILSIMDQLFNGTMQELLAQVSVDVPIRDALLRREGELGADLRLATLIFPSDRDTAEDPAPLLQALNVQAEQLGPLVQQAFTWAHGITRAAP
ncbi:HDOD domain-containing protein [uncultured Castellaniella sp.]|uniref:EAL and HDOD domain-containing protein n=1 Tax=uncultured Castellaniella sp. TaxID=647907 RepID=UPI00261FB92B|nr:HDOD domain-containing protein [uncultured Castellaniella sp.]